MSETHLPDAIDPPSSRENRQSAPPLASLRAFEAAARRLSFRDAATEIGLTPSAVSHHVRNLEALLGVRLFERRAREVVLTPDGQVLAAALIPAFSAIAQAYSKAANLSLRLKLSAAPLFASRHILPHIGALNLLIPGVSFSVESTLERSDVVQDPRSMALFFGPEPSGLRAVEVAASLSIVVASPDLSESLPPDIHSLASVALLTISRRPSHWAALLKAHKVSGGRREIFFDSIEGVMQAAEAGVGLALLPAIICEEAVRGGRIVQVYPEAVVHGWGYWLVAAPDSPAAKHLTGVALWLRNQIDKSA